MKRSGLLQLLFSLALASSLSAQTATPAPAQSPSKKPGPAQAAPPTSAQAKPATRPAQPAPAPQLGDLAPLRAYILAGWDKLTRSPRSCATFTDLRKESETATVYLPQGVATPEWLREMAKKCPLHLQQLPQKIEKLGTVDMKSIGAPGLLFLEHSYVVPGGFFNEMYGWDSYFILRGLLRDGRFELAKGMVENFFFEIEHYGAILNANRTYFLTRSQPPFLTSMILAVAEADPAPPAEKRRWLERAYEYARKDHALWVVEPHLAGSTGLSRYFDFGTGPAPDVIIGEDRYYEYVTKHFLRTRGVESPFVSAKAAEEAKQDGVPWPLYAVQVCQSDASGQAGKKCETLGQVGPTADFYKGDRAMRESGFDISHRFDSLSGATHHFAAVCLNSLLYKAETDLAQIARTLGRAAESAQWTARARERKLKVNRYFWNAAKGQYFDFDTRSNRQSTYEYASTFYPLWAGLASPEQARAVAANLKRFEEPGGIVMSRTESKAQWDWPYGWAPLQLITAEGLRRYGYQAEADRVSRKFVSMVGENLARDGTIREKYNVVTRSSETKIEAGYSENVVGFGWTNGVVLELLHGLERPKAAAARAR